MDRSAIMTAAGAVDNKIDYNALEQKGDLDISQQIKRNRPPHERAFLTAEFPIRDMMSCPQLLRQLP